MQGLPLLGVEPSSPPLSQLLLQPRPRRTMPLPPRCLLLLRALLHPCWLLLCCGLQHVWHAWLLQPGCPAAALLPLLVLLAPHWLALPVLLVLQTLLVLQMLPGLLPLLVMLALEMLPLPLALQMLPALLVLRARAAPSQGFETRAPCRRWSGQWCRWLGVWAASTEPPKSQTRSVGAPLPMTCPQPVHSS